MNKYCKIKNISGKPVNFVCAMPGSGSKGILLQAGESVITYDLGIKTSTLGVQERRNLITIEENFDNELYKFSLYENINDAILVDKVKFLEAEKNAEQYINK